MLKFVALFALDLPVTLVNAQEVDTLTTEKARESYAVGVDMARNIKGRAVQVEVAPLLRGMRDMLSGGKLLMTDEDIRKTLRVWQDGMRTNRVQANMVAPGTEAQQNLAKGLAFLEQNKTNAGVVTLPSGLQYRIIKTGTGPKPSATDTVECHHRSAFIDGKEYNSTYLVGTPATFKVSQAVAGWKEVLPLMPVGSKWQLFIPPQLAYGEKGVLDGRGRTKIAPNSTLICELELIRIK